MFVFYFPNLQSLCHVCKILHRKSAHLSCACRFDIAEFLSPCSDYATSLGSPGGPGGISQVMTWKQFNANHFEDDTKRR